MTDLERARDTHAHISCYTNWNTPSISSQFSTGVRRVQKTACKTNCNFQAGTWSSPSLFSLSFYCNLHARYTHHMRLAVAQQSTMQRAIKAGRLYAVTGSHAMQSALPSRYELAESRSCGEARALTSTLRANRYLPWWSPPRHATDRQQPSQRARECAWAQTSRLRCSACRVLIRAALNSPNFFVPRVCQYQTKTSSGQSRSKTCRCLSSANKYSTMWSVLSARISAMTHTTKM